MVSTIQNNNYFSDFVDNIMVEEPIYEYSLFDIYSNKITQTSIFDALEQKLNIISARKLQGLVHFQNAIQQPVQRWYGYREGYSTQLVNIFIKELNISRNILDPFSGSGTTLLSARNNNLQSFGIEINPLSVLVSKAENENYDKADIKDLKILINDLVNLKIDTTIRTTEFELADKVFNFDILQSLLFLKDWHYTIKNEKVRNLFFVSWLSIVESVSNVKKEGNGIKYKHRKRTSNGYIELDRIEWENSVFPANKFSFVKNKISLNLHNILFDIENCYGNVEKKPLIYNQDCLALDNFIDNEIQLTFYSPPYCNCFDYFEIHKVELWLGDFVKNREDLRKLRNTGFRSNTNSLKLKPINYQNQNLEKLIGLFDTSKLWDKNIVNVVRGYFDDTYTLLKKIYNSTEKSGYVGIVVGNSAYTGIVIPTDLIIAEIAQEIGFNVNAIYIARHLTTSSQQRKELEPLKSYLRESIVLLQK